MRKLELLKEGNGIEIEATPTGFAIRGKHNHAVSSRVYEITIEQAIELHLWLGKTQIAVKVAPTGGSAISIKNAGAFLE